MFCFSIGFVGLAEAVAGIAFARVTSLCLPSCLLSALLD